jgi:hypothetical protein
MARLLLLLYLTAKRRIKAMAAQENSVQFSLKELVSLEANRRQEEDARAKQREEEEAKQRAQAEAQARRLEVEAESRRAAERATQQARFEAEQMLATERARISAEEKRSTITLQPAPQGRSSAWMGIAAMAFSVVGLGISLMYLVIQPAVASVRTIKPPLTITLGDENKAPPDIAAREGHFDEEALKSDSENKGKSKVVETRKDPKNKELKKPACDHKKDPICGVIFDEN